MNYLSVCSGIEAVSVAWKDLDFTPVGFSEIEPFPCSLLNHYYPDVPNFGDMTKFKEWEIKDAVNVVVGGTPCQSFSIAGLREGLKDTRGNLALTFLAILEKFKPTWFIWENVPGVLSSSKGQDFRTFLQAANEIGYSCAWRVLDAQYFGVPQRRKRVFVVGHFGDWKCSAKVLFEPESLQGDIKTRASEKKTSTCALEKSTGRILQPTSYAITTSNQRWEPTQESYVAFQSNASSAHSMPVCENHTPTLTTSTRDMAIAKLGATLTRGFGDCGVDLDQIAGGNCAISIAENIINRSDKSGGNGIGASEGPMYTLTTANPHGVCYKSQLRRLTPLECERLQGFPDNYTLIPYKGSLSADSPRYKAIGNSMAVPVMRWIGERILEVEKGD